MPIDMECTMISYEGFYVGDPSYVLNERNRGGGTYCCCGTAKGNGIYRDNNGVEYRVDTGEIGVIAGELIDPDKRDDMAKKYSTYLPCKGLIMRAMVSVENGVFRILISDHDEDWYYVVNETIKIDTNEVEKEEGETPPQNTVLCPKS